MENITKSVRALRRAAHRADKQKLSPDDILRECLFAPPAVLRACTAELSVPFLAEPLGPRSLIVFLVAKAYKSSGDLDVAFLGDQWSACPARRVVPEMLRAAWHVANHDEPAKDGILDFVRAEVAQLEPRQVGAAAAALSKINGWGKIWTRGVH